MILAWATLLLFCGTFIAVGIFGITSLLPWMELLIYGVLATVAFGSILAKIPFTLQYARRMVDQSLWDKPGFRRVNYLMTGVWGCVFAINLFLSYLAMTIQGPSGRFVAMSTFVVLISGIVFTIWYPGYVQRRYATAVPAQGI
jgi:hypothetical protein